MCPRVLVLHIKRFLFDHADEITIKRHDSIALSATLDISRFCAQEMKFSSPELAAASPTYKLRSFLNHTGEDNAGHYISYSRTKSWCPNGGTTLHLLLAVARAECASTTTVVGPYLLHVLHHFHA